MPAYKEKEDKDFKDQPSTALAQTAAQVAHEEMLEKESSDPVSNGQDYLSQSRQANIRTNLQTPTGTQHTEDGLRLRG